MRYLKKSLFKAVVAYVKGVNPKWIDKGVKYPKIDLHSWIENTPTDKESSVREISFIVEAYSNTSYDEAVTMADTIAQGLCENPIEVEGAEVVSTSYYTADGVAVSAPVKGVNIVKYVYSNGATKTVKFVK